MALPLVDVVVVGQVDGHGVVALPVVVLDREDGDKMRWKNKRKKWKNKRRKIKIRG